jgi:hypothetical protein
MSNRNSTLNSELLAIENRLQNIFLLITACNVRQEQIARLQLLREEAEERLCIVLKQNRDQFRAASGRG